MFCRSLICMHGAGGGGWSKLESFYLWRSPHFLPAPPATLRRRERAIPLSPSQSPLTTNLSDKELAGQDLGKFDHCAVCGSRSSFQPLGRSSRFGSQPISSCIIDIEPRILHGHTARYGRFHRLLPAYTPHAT